MADKNDMDPTWQLMLLMALAGGFCWAIWFFFHPQILEGLRWFRIVELWVFGFFDSQARGCAKWLFYAKVGADAIPNDDAYKWAQVCFGGGELKSLSNNAASAYYNITSESMSFVRIEAQQFIRWPAIALCVAFGVHMMFFSVRNKFKMKHTLESFIRAQADMWPVLSPVVNFNPAKHSARIPGQAVPDKLPPFAEALSPEEWLAYHRIPVTDSIPARESVRRAFVAQLGPRWQGPDKLPLYIAGLFAAFALQGAQKRDACDDLLGKLAKSWSLEGGLKISPELEAYIQKTLRDSNIGGKAVEIAAVHAWRTTALLGVLKWARFMGGVLAPAQFLWLRAVDRELWYPLNNLGRRSFHSEGAGAMGHFMAEQAAKKPLLVPRVDTAIITMNQYLAVTSVKIPSRQEAKGSKA